MADLHSNSRTAPVFVGAQLQWRLECLEQLQCQELWGGRRATLLPASQLAVYGGEACPASPESRPCTDTIECPVSPVCLVCLKANIILLCFSQVSCSGDWSAWSSCNASSCGKGVELRYFQSTQLAAYGGEACPASPESRPCADNSGCTSNVRHDERCMKTVFSSSSRMRCS